MKHGYSPRLELLIGILTVISISLFFLLPMFHPIAIIVAHEIFAIIAILVAILIAIVVFRFNKLSVQVSDIAKCQRPYSLSALILVCVSSFILCSYKWTTISAWGIWTHYKLTTDFKDIEQWSKSVKLDELNFKTFGGLGGENIPEIPRKYHAKYVIVDEYPHKPRRTRLIWEETVFGMSIAQWGVSLGYHERFSPLSGNSETSHGEAVSKASLISDDSQYRPPREVVLEVYPKTYIWVLTNSF